MNILGKDMIVIFVFRLNIKWMTPNEIVAKCRLKLEKKVYLYI